MDNASTDYAAEIIKLIKDERLCFIRIKKWGTKTKRSQKVSSVMYMFY